MWVRALVRRVELRGFGFAAAALLAFALALLVRVVEGLVGRDVLVRVRGRGPAVLLAPAVSDAGCGGGEPPLDFVRECAQLFDRGTGRPLGFSCGRSRSLR